MEVCSSTEMGAPGASHLGTGDHGPKTDRSRPRSVPVNAGPVIWKIHAMRLAEFVVFPVVINERMFSKREGIFVYGLYPR
jgi:hypothetical protein